MVESAPSEIAASSQREPSEKQLKTEPSNEKVPMLQIKSVTQPIANSV